jgi:CO/xanthine dehydrogenase FAD-binding subunit
MAYIKFSHPASRYAVIGAAAVVTMKGGSCEAAQVAIGGLVPVPARLRDVEAAVKGARPSQDVTAKAAAEPRNNWGETFSETSSRRLSIARRLPRLRKARAGCGVPAGVVA